MMVLPHQRARRGNPCPACGGTDKCLVVSIDGEHCYCINPPGHLRKAAWATNFALFGRDFYRIPLAEVGVATHQRVELPEEHEPWYGYQRAMQDLYQRLELSDVWYDHLLDRGLEPSEVEQLGYVSLPARQRDCHELAELLHLRYSAHWSQIPGCIYDRKERPRFKASPGCLLIPIRDYGGQLLGFQTRSHGKQYRWFSHDALLKTPIHHAGRENQGPWLVTEGPIKADIIALRTAFRILSYQGVSALSELPPLLPRLPDRQVIYIANDMDLFIREGVLRGTKRCAKILGEHFDQVRCLLWWSVPPDCRPKGLDDWLVEGHRHLYHLDPDALLDSTGPYTSRGKGTYSLDHWRRAKQSADILDPALWRPS